MVLKVTEPVYLKARREKEAQEAGLIPEGSREGYPTARFDPQAGRWFHLDGAGERVYHGVPAGYTCDASGALQPVLPEALAEEIAAYAAKSGRDAGLLTERAKALLASGHALSDLLPVLKSEEN